MDLHVSHLFPLPSTLHLFQHLHALSPAHSPDATWPPLLLLFLALFLLLFLLLFLFLFLLVAFFSAVLILTIILEGSHQSGRGNLRLGLILQG